VADVTALEAARERFAKEVAAAGGKLTVTVIAARIVAVALKRFPRLNSSLDPAAQEIVFKDSVHLGIAVDTERGLLVPVIRDAETKGVIRIAKEIGDLAEQARSGRIAPDDLSGATFTLTNLGSIGGTHFSPIVAWPQAGVLGLGRAYEALSPETDAPRLLLPLSLSYDHRLVDGADGARFIRWVTEALEAPLRLILDA
jgi:pyruvate dehydrogenase E2 component (dihydrolipoamide acetyltransferase)